MWCPSYTNLRLRLIFLIKDVSIAVSIDVSTGIETNTIRWIEETNATEYLVRIFVKDVKEPVSYLGDGKNTTLEIVHSGLESKTGKSLPDPVTVNVTVLAIRENEFIGTQSLFNIGKCFYIKS